MLTVLDLIFDFLGQAITEIFGDLIGRRFQRRRARRLASHGKVLCALRDAPAGGKHAKWRRGTADLGRRRIRFKGHDVVVEAADVPGETKPAGRNEAGHILWFDPEVRVLQLTTPAGQRELAILEWQAQWAIDTLMLSDR